MGILIFIFILMLLTGAIAGPLVYMRNRSQLRDQKNYERGLKMVPLLIHLPPPSEDAESGGRDTRDLVDENISRAQVIYNIIASTFQKSDYNTKMYGQRHFSFEIIGTSGFVHFYAAVPVPLLEVVKQAIVSAYPAARLEEAPEHNIFNAAGKLPGTIGGQLNLKEEFAYPIATYQDLKRDAMQALLNAMSTLNKEDGVAVQILMRPADSSWRKTASEVASKKRKGKDNKKKGHEQLFTLSKDVAKAFVKPPETKDDKGGEKKNELSSLEQAVLDSIDDKTRYPGYEVLIRIVVSSNVSHRAQAVLSNIVAAFSLFDAPGKNGFKFDEASDMDEFVTSYLLRMFPQTENKNVLNAVELATIFHFPDQRSIPTSQLERQDSKQVDGPRNMPAEGLLLGYNIFRGVKKAVRLGIADRQRHMYAVGQTGTGKTTFLENLAFQDMLSGGGFAFVDPHGDVAERLLALVPKERTEDVIYFCPSDTDYPMGLNLFEYKTSEQKDFLIQEVLNMLYKLYDPQHQGIMGPRYEHLFRNAALTIMADPEGGSFVDVPKLFRDSQFVDQKLKYVKDQNVIEFWKKEMPQSQRSNEFGEVVSWFVSKFGAFLSNEMMRNIIGQTKSAFDLRDIMDNNKILLVNLSKGKTGELNSKLLGMIFVMKFQAAAMSRAELPEDQRKDFALYVDEFQNFSTDSFATILSEARKYHLNLIVANQFTTQLTDEIREAVFGNVGTIVAFRVGDHDVDSLAKYFSPTFDGSDLLKIPNHNTVVRTLVGGVPTNAFSMATIPPLGSPNYKLAEALKQLSAAKYGRPKGMVEKEIFARLATKPQPPAAPAGSRFDANRPGALGAPGQPVPSTQNRFGAGQQPAPQAPGGVFGRPAPATPNGYGAPQPPAPAKPASFLDDWMAKRSRPQPQYPALPPSNPAAPNYQPAAPPRPTPAPYNPTEPVQQTLPPRKPAPAVEQHHEAYVEPGYRDARAKPTHSAKKKSNPTPAELEAAEIETITNELKQDLPVPPPRDLPPVPPLPEELPHKQTPTPAPKVPAAITKEQKPMTHPASTEEKPVHRQEPHTEAIELPPLVSDEPTLAPKPQNGEVNLRSDQGGEEDTIFIDPDGNLTLR